MSRWDSEFSSASISLAKEFSKSNKVFYIDNPFTIKDFILEFNSPKIKHRRRALLFGKQIYRPIIQGSDNLIAVTPKLVSPINWLPKGSLYKWFSRVNNKVIIASIRKILKDFSIKDYILFNSFNPFYGIDIPRDIRPIISIYQSRDDISESPYVKKHGIIMENRAISQADYVFATSLGLIKKIAPDDKKIHYLPNAAEVSIFNESFSKLKRPRELENIKDKKIIGYTGNICHRINYDLLKTIAENNLDKIILLVGPINNQAFFNMRLNKMPNIITTGPKSIYDLPAYLKYIDCAIIPFLCNELTKSIYPLKINEYLAAGRPVVSTSFSEDLRSFKKVIYLSRNEKDFLGNINQAINEDNEDKVQERTLFAKDNTWENRVKLFWNLVN